MFPREDNLLLMSDSYKASHWLQYPPGTENVYSYLESRGGEFDETVFFGLQYIIKKHLEGIRVSWDNILEAEEFWKAHFGREMFNSEGWKHIFYEHGGRLPIRIKAVPEGTVVPTRNVLVTVENTDPKCWWLTNFVETLLVQLWYPITVATNSREIKKTIKKYLELTGDPEGLAFKLHDFGYRGVSSNETAAIGGLSHLVNFSGTDTVAGIVAAMNYYNAGMCGFSIPACFDSKTEILTRRGWKRFEKLEQSEQVAQYHPAGYCNFVTPSRIHCGPYSGKMVRFSSDSTTAAVDLLVTPNHRMVRRSKETGQVEIQQASDALFSQRSLWPQGGHSAWSGPGLKPLDQLKIAFQADGSFPSRKDNYTGKRTGTFPIRFNLKKERKIQRLQEILKSAGITYTQNPDSSERQNFWITPTEQLSKKFDWVDLALVTREWCKEFVEEISQWDGTVKGENVIYTTVDEFNADIVQACAMLAGYRASKRSTIDEREDYSRQPLFHVNVCKTRNTRQGTKIRKSAEDYDGIVHCVTVPTGMVIVRRNGFISVSGNSEHSTITSWGKEHEVDAFANMLEQYPEGLVACVSDSYDIYQACEEYWGKRLKDKVLKRDGTLVVRPDSGPVVETVLGVLQALWAAFGGETNGKGYRVLDPHVRVIQGDGIDRKMVETILMAMKDKGFSADNIAFGSGGGLLQQHNRDTCQFAFKCSHITVDGEGRDVWKDPVTSKAKASKRGRLKLIHTAGKLRTMQDVPGQSHGVKDELRTIFENGEFELEHTFDKIRERAGL